MSKNIQWVDLSNGRPVRLLYNAGDFPQGTLFTGPGVGWVHGSNAYNIALAIAVKDRKVYVTDENGGLVPMETSDPRPVATADIGMVIKEILSRA